jgi:hypothetical protein
MRVDVQGLGFILLLALLGWSAPAVAAGTSAPQSRPPAAARPSSTSWCLAKCVELEVACKAFENRHPTCSPDDICLDEKTQCEALCKPRVKLWISACL